MPITGITAPLMAPPERPAGGGAETGAGGHADGITGNFASNGTVAGAGACGSSGWTMGGASPGGTASGETSCDG